MRSSYAASIDLKLPSTCGRVIQITPLKWNHNTENYFSSVLRESHRSVNTTCKTLICFHEAVQGGEKKNSAVQLHPVGETVIITDMSPDGSHDRQPRLFPHLAKKFRSLLDFMLSSILVMLCNAEFTHPVISHALRQFELFTLRTSIRMSLSLSSKPAFCCEQIAMLWLDAWLFFFLALMVNPRSRKLPCILECRLKKEDAHIMSHIILQTVFQLVFFLLFWYWQFLPYNRWERETGLNG